MQQFHEGHSNKRTTQQAHKMKFSRWIPRKFYYGHAGKEVAGTIANKTGFDKDPIVQAYLNRIVDTMPVTKRRSPYLARGSAKRTKVTTTYKRIGRMPFKRMSRARSTRRPYATKRKYARKPTVMSMAESKHIIQSTYGTVIVQDVETVVPVTMPVTSLTYTKDTFQGRRLYVTGMKYHFSFVNNNPTKDKMVIVTVAELPANESIADTEIWRGVTGELDENLHTLPISTRARARVSKHSDHKIIYRKAFKLHNTSTNSDAPNYRHWKTWIPINKQLLLDRGEDGGADVLDKRYQLRMYQTNLDGTAVADGFNTVQITGTSSVFYFKDL